MEKENFESTNIHLDWLNNIYGQLKMLQDFERIAREGSRSLMEYLQIPFEYQRVVMPDAQYKNMRFFAMELDILISNLSSAFKEEDKGDKVKEYKKRLEPILRVIDNRHLFLREKKMNNQLIEIQVLPFLNTTVKFLISIKSDIILDIGHILYLPEEVKKTW
jgi:hypothetical protein